MAAAKNKEVEVKEKGTFRGLLTRDDASLEKETGDIIARGVKNTYGDIIREQVSSLDKMVMDLKKMKNINVSNSLMSANRTDESFDGVAWARRHNDLTQRIALAKAEVKISDTSYVELFGESYLELQGLSL